ncbi:hypothetical protein OS493_025722 [Desmophyllum pertusum]|uniref:Uncharacterized protein n=1 Tax=Desmophyllum pertusum TaxID=174260 RepID=A0A9X0D253_9CNID|nr:hypothetical protein OS493_025722 [Desmophyllum pertusum]
MDMRDKLEEKFDSLNLQLDQSLVLSTSDDEEQPSTSGSPGVVFKRAGMSSM